MHLKHLLTLCLSLFLLRVQAQESPAIPLDTAVRMGKLENGMTYYIRQNAKPENRAELRLVVNAGSILEDKDQQGLAHFLEHMAFNGTKNFEKNQLVDYLQSVGVKFGAHLNAYTSFDETVYMLFVPTDSAEILNTGFQILEDWAHQITLDKTEIDKERGVVIEEWRLGRGAGERMRKKWFPVVYEDSRYAERLPIGKKDVLESFSQKTIKRFYEDWYRPDLMAVVVVGDIDPDQIEAKIRKQFGGIPAAKKPRERTVFDVPIKDKNTVTVAADPESTFTQILLMHKKAPKPFRTEADYRRKLVYGAFTGMLSNRLAELRESANPPFFAAGGYYGRGMGSAIDVYQFSAIVDAAGVKRGVEVLVEENQRVKQHGFIASELERYKRETLRQYEKAYNERDKVESSRHAREYVSHFLDAEPTPGIAYEYAMVQKMLPEITLEEVNALRDELVRDENRSLVVMAAEKEGVELPSEEDLEALIQEVSARELEPYTEAEIADALMEKAPEMGQITEEETLEEIGVTRLTFANGLEVVLKPTDFKNDEILISAYSPGGHSLYDDQAYKSATFASGVISEAGIADLPSTDLMKFMSDKQVRVSPYIGSTSEGFNGSCSPKDLEVALQMTHLYFTAPRKDETAFESMKQRDKMLYQSLMGNPDLFFSDEVSRILSQDHPRRGGFPKPEDFDAIDFEKAHEVYQDRFADASDFTFYFVGNFEVEEIKPLLRAYLGSLPGKGRQEEGKDLGIRPPKGMVSEEVRRGTEEKSTVRLYFTGETEYDGKEAYYLRSLGELLGIKLIEQLREEKSGVYGASAQGYMQKEPFGKYTFTVSFPCSPDNVEDLIQATLDEIEKIRKKGPEEKDLEKIKKAQKRDHEVKSKENRYWLTQLRNADLYDRDPLDLLKHDEKVDALTGEDLQQVAQKYLDTKNFIRIVLYPEKTE